MIIQVAWLFDRKRFPLAAALLDAWDLQEVYEDCLVELAV